MLGAVVSLPVAPGRLEGHGLRRGPPARVTDEHRSFRHRVVLLRLPAGAEHTRWRLAATPQHGDRDSQCDGFGLRGRAESGCL